MSVDNFKGKVHLQCTGCLYRSLYQKLFPAVATLMFFCQPRCKLLVWETVIVGPYRPFASPLPICQLEPDLEGMDPQIGRSCKQIFIASPVKRLFFKVNVSLLLLPGILSGTCLGILSFSLDDFVTTFFPWRRRIDPPYRFIYSVLVRNWRPPLKSMRFQLLCFYYRFSLVSLSLFSWARSFPEVDRPANRLLIPVKT